MSDLEDADHLTQSTLRNANLRVAQLELERMEHLSALDTGLLVEKAHVTTELSRLMERVSEEAAQRGMAENAKHEIEKVNTIKGILFALSAHYASRIWTILARPCLTKPTPWSPRLVLLVLRARRKPLPAKLP